jgi:hypothetical protein
MRFKSFIDDLLLQGFESFVTLYFPGPRPSWEYASEWELLREGLRDITDEKRRAARQRRFDRAQGCHERWLAEVRARAPSDDTRYISVIEDRASKRDVMFHVLLGGCDLGEYDLNGEWSPRWNELSGGKAFMREIDERIGGLLRYFVFKKYCPLEVACGTVQGRFIAEQFEDLEEWKHC